VRQFLADASHELRTPLSTITGYAELSRRTTGGADIATQNAVLRHAMSRVDVESVRMAALVDDLLLLARLDAGRPLDSEPVDVSRIAVEALNDARVVAPDHRWLLALPDVPTVVVGDGHRLHQVVANLLSNALRHTPPGTSVRLDVVSSDDEVTVTVHDDGPGLPTDLQVHAFERFTRADSSRTRDTGGSGLGLSIVEAIVQAHGGTVEVASGPGDTTFTVRLPRPPT
jgi:two-component system, OmpR family, sensor kinase